MDDDRLTTSGISRWRYPELTELIQALVDEQPSKRPSFRESGGMTIAIYSCTRFTLKRSAVERLPSDGLLVVHVDRPELPSWTFAIARRDFESLFSDLRRSRSWETRGSHDFSGIPPRIANYILPPRQASDVE